MTLLAVNSAVATIAFDTNDIGGTYKSKIEQVLTDTQQSIFYNSYRNGIRKDVVFDEIEHILRDYQKYKDEIDKNMAIEANKAQSFFACLDTNF